MTHSTDSNSTHRRITWPRKLMVSSLLFAGGAGYMAMATPPALPPATEKAIQGLEQSGQAFSAIAKRISPAVVSIRIEKKTGNDISNGLPGDDQENPLNDEFFKRFFGGRVPEQFRQRQAPSQKHAVVGQGSGFVVTSDGNILTNHHVVADASKLIVKFADGRELVAKVVGSDPQIDVAVIKVDATNLPTLPLGDSSRTEVGEWVLASGAPYGLTQTLTAGIVSAVGRNSVGITSYENFIQTDAAINPGNSGGPLVNLRGEVIGINTAIFSRNGGSVGLGFAIPVDMAKQSYDQILAHGSVVRGYMGVAIQALSSDLAEQFKITDHHGILVGQVQKNSPSEKAGLVSGDVITAMDGKKVDDVAAFRNAIAMKAPGTKVSLAVLRDGKSMDVTVTLDQLPGTTAATMTEQPVKQSNSWGLSVQPLTSELAQKFGYQLDSGIVISEVVPGSPASEAGLETGMLIQQVNRKTIQSVDEFNQIVSADKNPSRLLLLISNGHGTKFVVLKMSA